LRQCIEEIERLGPTSTSLGAYLRRCVHDYDMGRILRLVSEGGGERFARSCAEAEACGSQASPEVASGVRG